MNNVEVEMEINAKVDVVLDEKITFMIHQMLFLKNLLNII